jgi:hypothetical protein
MAGRQSIGHYLHAHVFDFRDIRQHFQATSPPAYIRWGEAKHFRRRSIETRHLAVAVDHDDGNIDRIKYADPIGVYRVRGRNVAMLPRCLGNIDLSVA